MSQIVRHVSQTFLVLNVHIPRWDSSLKLGAKVRTRVKHRDISYVQVIWSLAELREVGGTVGFSQNRDIVALVHKNLLYVECTRIVAIYC
jgi:hypothetical protein